MVLFTHKWWWGVIHVFPLEPKRRPRSSASLDLHEQLILNSPEDEGSDSQCSNGAPEITSSAETTHVPMVHELYVNESQHQKVVGIQMPRLAAFGDSPTDGRSSVPHPDGVEESASNPFLFDTGASRHTVGDSRILRKLFLLPRSSANDDRCDKMSVHNYLHKARSPSSPRLDLKPANILLDADMTPKVSGFGLSRVLGRGGNTDVSLVRAGRTHGYMPRQQIKSDIWSLGVVVLEANRGQIQAGQCYSNTQIYPIKQRYSDAISHEVKFSGTTSAKGGIDIKIGSHKIHVPKYLSVHHPLIQMVLFACKRFEGIFFCLKSMVPKSIFDMAKRICLFASPNLCEACWIPAKPKLESPNAGTVSEFNPRESIGRSNDLTENESQYHRAERGIKAVEAKTSASWVVTTAAPHHATGNCALLSGFITEHDDDQFVHAVDGVPMQVRARGAVVTDAVVLSDVWFVPGLTVNLVSVSQLAELDYNFGFGCGACCIRSAADGTIVGKARLREGGLYVLDFLKIPLAM